MAFCSASRETSAIIFSKTFSLDFWSCKGMMSSSDILDEEDDERDDDEEQKDDDEVSRLDVLGDDVVEEEAPPPPPYCVENEDLHDFIDSLSDKFFMSMSLPAAAAAAFWGVVTLFLWAAEVAVAMGFFFSAWPIRPGCRARLAALLGVMTPVFVFCLLKKIL